MKIGKGLKVGGSSVAVMWEGTGWEVGVDERNVDDVRIIVNTASAAPTGEQAMRPVDASMLVGALRTALRWVGGERGSDA